MSDWWMLALDYSDFESVMQKLIGHIYYSEGAAECEVLECCWRTSSQTDEPHSAEHLSISEIFCLFCSSLEIVSLSGWLVLFRECSKSSGCIVFLLTRQILELIERIGCRRQCRSGTNHELFLPQWTAQALKIVLHISSWKREEASLERVIYWQCEGDTTKGFLFIQRAWKSF